MNQDALISLFVVAIGLSALLSLTLGCIVCHIRRSGQSDCQQLEKDRLLHDLVDDILHGRANLPSEHPAAAAAIAAIAGQQGEGGVPVGPPRAVGPEVRERMDGDADEAHCGSRLHRVYRPTREAVRLLSVGDNGASRQPTKRVLLSDLYSLITTKQKHNETSPEDSTEVI